jgi:hypothetical protein
MSRNNFKRPNQFVRPYPRERSHFMLSKSNFARDGALKTSIVCVSNLSSKGAHYAACSCRGRRKIGS